MYRAINEYVIVKVAFNDNLKQQVLEGEVVATTDVTAELQGKIVLAARHKYIELSETEEDAITDSGIILGSKNKYGSLKLEDIIAVKHDQETSKSGK